MSKNMPRVHPLQNAKHACSVQKTPKYCSRRHVFYYFDYDYEYYFFPLIIIVARELAAVGVHFFILFLLNLQDLSCHIQFICQVSSSFHLLLHKHDTMSDVSAIVLTNMKPH